MRFTIGPYTFDNFVALAPMAGVTDKPFRKLCRRFGASLATTEMVTSNPELWKSKKSRLRMDHEGEGNPVSVQIAGTIPTIMAEAAQYNVDRGAHIIDINMGCPAKKVCNKMAGSALMQDEKLVEAILNAVVKAVNVPVTLKMRTGLYPGKKNGTIIARIAEECGIQAIAIHGRTRSDGYKGQAEYDTIKTIKETIGIPVFANGDITSIPKAKYVLDYTGADGLLIGRAAQGSPWIFRELKYYLQTGAFMQKPTLFEIRKILLEHLQSLYTFYGEYSGLRIARKHIAWYLKNSCCENPDSIRSKINRISCCKQQLQLISDFFNANIEHWEQNNNEGRLIA